MKAIKILLGLVSVLVLSGCEDLNAAPSAESIRAADYGPAPTRNYYESAIRKHKSLNLRDPYSAVYNFEAPRKAYLTVFFDAAPFASPPPPQIKFGWVVQAGINAKNAYGGYTGVSWETYFFKDGKVLRLINDSLPLLAGEHIIYYAVDIVDGNRFSARWDWAEK